MTLPAVLNHAAEAFRATGHALAGELAAHLAEAARLPFEAEPRRPEALAHLAPALAAADAHPLVPALAGIAARLPWQEAEEVTPARQMVGRHAYVELVGPDGVIAHDRVSFGLYLQAPEIFYPAHSHAAEELYFVLSGTARWQQDGAPFAAKDPGTLIHHAPWEAHATHTGAEPLLAMWAWFGDLRAETYRLHGVA